MRSLLAFAVSMVVVACGAPPGAAAPSSGGSASSRPSPSPSPSATQPLSPPPPPSAAAPRVERYVAMGASDTVGVGAADPRTGSWPARIAARLPAGSTYTNLGVSGSLALPARTEQSPAAIAARPTVITIWLAVNDLNNGISSTAYRDVLAGLLGELVTRTEARIFVGNLPDLTAVPVYRGRIDPALRAQVAAYNRWIAETVAMYPGRVILVDLFTGSAELMGTATVAPDGFHPSDGGYQLIADRFLAAMRGAAIPLRD